MPHFTNDFIKFFKELEKNNNKEWFHANKKRYEKSVKKPFHQMLEDLIGEIRKLDKSYTAEAKDCVARINRDIRFSKDKTPYNTHFTAFISPKGKKDKTSGGIFIRLSHKGVGVMTGLYGMEKDQLMALRETIAKDPKKFRKAIEDKKFTNVFGTIQGEKNKRLPTKELQAAAEQEPLILNNQFYFFSERKPDLITGNKLIKELVDHWKVARPVNQYLKNAIS